MKPYTKNRAPKFKAEKIDHVPGTAKGVSRYDKLITKNANRSQKKAVRQASKMLIKNTVMDLPSNHRFIGNDENGIPQYEWTVPYITGYHGCKCHPFLSWPESDKAHRQKFKVDDVVINRCTGKIGVITKVLEQYFYHVSTMGLEHSAMLKPF